MKKLLSLCFVLLSCYGQLASSITIYKPSGEFITIQETGYGFSVYDTEKKSITSVTDTQDGYVIFPQDGEPTFIRMDPSEKHLEEELVVPSVLDDDLL